LTGDQVQELFEVAKKHKFALPAVNIIGTNSINAVMETAKAVNSPVIIQLSNGGAQFYAGKTLNNDNLQACVLGAVSAAQHVHLLAEHYGVAVILHTDHAAKLYLGSTVCWTLARNSLRNTENHCSLLTCWIYRKSQLKKILKFQLNT
jgi:fructose-bisphosphate aldolase class II